MFKNRLMVAAASILFCVSTSIFAMPSVLGIAPDTEINIETSDGTEITVSHYPAKGDTLILWIGSSYNYSPKTYKTAHLISQNNIEIWQVDLAKAFFEPRTSNFLRNLDAQYVADLIAIAHKKTGKKVILLTRAYGAIPGMRGATLWQQQHPAKNYLSGAILFSPDFFASIPELGLDPEYLPITRQTTLPTYIFQAARRGTAWQFPRLLKQLNQTNKHIYFSFMSGVSGIFYQNDDNPSSVSMLNRLPEMIPDIVKLLQETRGYQQPNDYTQNQGTPYTTLLNSHIKKFVGNSAPKPFSLNDSNGKLITRNEFKHKVTVVNFWATWCPPCVEEIPSLNRLRRKMQTINNKDTDFELISINYAETKPTIDKFLKQINVEFPVLLDHDGSVARQWNVIAFPSTFVIGPDGKIRYGVNAAIRWDSPEAIKLLKALF